VSGGAYGVDAAAHRGALRVGGRTIAVLGSGLGKPYPSDHIELFDDIVEQNCGAIVSEFPMLTSPRPEHFPRRNRIISGLSLGVLVIEAARRSGALITARLCVEEHGRECMALPGAVDSPASAGTNELIQKGGASLVTSAQAILEQLGEAGRLLQAAAQERESDQEMSEAAAQAQPPNLFELNLSDSQTKLIQALDHPRTLDELVEITRLTASAIQADITMLEIRGAVQRQGGRFSRRANTG
jgi:DNA processing protein